MFDFKILITTTCWASSGVSVHTVVAFFSTAEEALKAVNAVNGNPHRPDNARRDAIPLF